VCVCVWARCIHIGGRRSRQALLAKAFSSPCCCTATDAAVLFWLVGEGGCTKSAKSCYKEEFVFIYWRRFWLALYSGFSYLGLNWGLSARFHRGFSPVFFLWDFLYRFNETIARECDRFSSLLPKKCGNIARMCARAWVGVARILLFHLKKWR
jgi:hypothetical protein